MMVIEYQDQLIIIDAGLAFPSEDYPGIDLIIPDVTYLLEKKQQILGIILTHGHEDHIGGLPYILKQLLCPITIYGTKMTLGLVSNKTEEHPVLAQCPLETITAGQRLKLGPFEMEFIRVSHSVVDGLAIGLRTPEASLLHTGDFKLDPTPVDGQVTDLAAFGAWGKQGVDLLLADSTNVEREGFTLSEREVGRAFDEIVSQATGRVVIACFSSNVHRFQQIINTCQQSQRQLGVLGMSMIKNMRTAHELGYLNLPDQLWLRWSELQTLPPHKTIIMTTGSQGEPTSALARTAVGEHPELKLQPGDTVIISARRIPGNERRINAMINQLFQLGCQVHYERVSEIHVSGHAAKEELKIIHSLVRPKYFMPIHGELRHLVHHGQLAQEMGCPAENIIILDNGDRLTFSHHQFHVEKAVAGGKVLVDGKSMGNVDQVVLRDRRHLAQDGVVLIILGVDRQNGEVVTGPELLARGLSDEQDFHTIRDEAIAALQELLSQETQQAMMDSIMLQDKCRRTLKRFFKKKLMKFPIIIPVVMEV